MESKAALPGVATSPETALASELFDEFVSAGTFKAALFTYRRLCDVLRLKPNCIGTFYPKIKSKLHSWRAMSLWAKLDKRASHKCYNRGKVCPNTRVLIIGAGPCGLRAAIEAQLLGAKVVVIEKRDRFSRNNVLHLWPFVIHDLRNLGAKKFFGKFCASSIDHISIRQLQVILLKVSLLLGVEVHENVSFISLKEPPEDQIQERIGWHASVSPADHPVSQYEFDVLIGADGKRNTLSGFNRKEFRGKLAIAVTANFINKHTMEEARVPEISGVAFIFNQKFFQDMREETGIDLENIVYYKDDTHYFVMTAKKQSLLDRGVIINDHNDTARLLSAENVDREALMEYARDAAEFATNYQLPSLDFAVNHYGQADVAMFDFTSMYAAENACRITERRGHKLLQGLVGDSLLEPFWPTGSGCARGFLSSFDVAWMIRSWASGKLSNLQVIAEREAIYRLLAQTTPENLSKDLNQYTLNPTSRYPNLNLHSVLPSQVRSLYDTDTTIEDQIMDAPVEIPRKKRKRESVIHPDALLKWCQRQVALHENVKIENLTSSWKNGLALCAILHRYRPELINFETLNSEDVAKNNQLAFDICEKELGIPPVMTGQEMAESEVPDKLSMVSYLVQIYECFRGEIPVVRIQKSVNDDRATSPNRQSFGNSRSILAKISNKFQNKRKYSIEKEASKEKSESYRRGKHLSYLHKRRSKERDKGIALDLIKEVELSKISPLPSAPKESINSRVKNLELKMQQDAGLRCHVVEEAENLKSAPPLRSDHSELNIKMIQEQLQKNGKSKCDKKTTTPVVGRLRKDEWNVKMLEEKINLQQKTPAKQSEAEKSKILQDIFDNKLYLVDAKLKAGGNPSHEREKFSKFDSTLTKLSEKLSKGNLNAGERGSNQVSAMMEHMTTIWDKKKGLKRDPLPPAPVGTSVYQSQTGSVSQPGVSETCYFCKKRVYLMERSSAEGLFFHRSCFKCEYCSASLRLGTYEFDKDTVCGGKFYCRPHFRMQKPDPRWQEMMKRKQAFLSSSYNEQEKEKIYTTLLANAEKALSPNLYQETKEGQSVTDSPVPSSPSTDAKSQESRSPKLLLEPLNVIGRDQTPERVEYENSILDYSEEELLTSELEEEELTQKNLGPNHELITSDDDYSDFSTDSESDEEAYAEELERSLTADETRKLAETWQRKYSAEQSLLDTDSSSSSSNSSDTEIGSENGTSDDINSDEEYNIEHCHEDDVKNVDRKPKPAEPKNDLIVEVPVIILKQESEEDSDSEESDELSGSEEGSDVETDSEEESEPEVQLPPPQIPTIVIEDVDQHHECHEESSESDKKGSASGEKVSEESTLISSSGTTDSSPLQDAKITCPDEDISQVAPVDNTNYFETTKKHPEFISSQLAKQDLNKSKFNDRQELIEDFQNESETTEDAHIEYIDSLDTVDEAHCNCNVEIQKEPLKEHNSSETTSYTDPNSIKDAQPKLSEYSNVQLNDFNVHELCIPQEPHEDEEQRDALHVDSVPSNSDFTPSSMNSQSLSFPVIEENNSPLPTRTNAIDEVPDSNNFVSSAAVVTNTQMDENKAQCGSSTSNQIANSNENTCNDRKSSIENDPLFNPAFVTIRKKKKTHEDTFDWDSDKSMSTPWFCDSSEDIDFGDFAPISPKPSQGSDLAHQTVSENLTCSSKCTMPQEINTSNIGKENDSICSQPMPLSPKPHSPLELPTPRASIISSTPYPVPKIQSVEVSQENKAPVSETKSFNAVSAFSKPVLSSSSTISEKNWIESKIFSPIKPFNEKSAESWQISSGSTSLLSSSLIENSNNSFLDNTANSTSENCSKYSGYSGRFAEKMRPKSALGDTIYLRSLDINLQKQQFPSIMKSVDKLDDVSSCQTKKALFPNVHDSQSQENAALKRDFKRQTSVPLECSSINSKKKDASPLEIEKVEEIPPTKHPMSFSLYESYGNPISPYTYAQNRPIFENAFPVKMRPKCDMDLSKLREKREKRKSVHENIQGLPFADEEKAVTPSDAPYTPDNVFGLPGVADDLQTTDAQEQEILARLDKSAVQEQARKEARARARLKSDEELGLSPKNYRKKYQRQLSLSSIYYEEFNSDEFYDHENEELEMSDGTFHAKRVKIAEVQDEFLDVNSDSDTVSLKADLGKPIESSSNVAHSYEESTLATPVVKISPQETRTNFKPPISSSQDLASSRDEVEVFCFTLEPTSKTPDSPNAIVNEHPVAMKLEDDKVKMHRHFSEGTSDEEQIKSANKKSFFSILNFGKGNVFKDKSTKSKTKSAEKERASSLPAELPAKNSPKQSPFSNLKLNKSKEKPKDKLKQKFLLSEVAESSSNTVAANTALETIPNAEVSKSTLLNPLPTKIIPKYTVYKNPGASFFLPPAASSTVLQTENGFAPKASEDNFSDEENQKNGAARKPCETGTDAREISEKVKKVQRMVQKVYKQQEMKRLRSAQEIQRRLEELEIEQKQLEELGVEVEKALRKEDKADTQHGADSELMQEWYRLMHSKNILLREEQELYVRLKDLELEDRHSRLQQEMRERMTPSDSPKNPVQLGEEKKILTEMLRIVEERDELVAMLEQLRIKEEEDNKYTCSQIE